MRKEKLTAQQRFDQLDKCDQNHVKRFFSTPESWAAAQDSFDAAQKETRKAERRLAKQTVINAGGGGSSHANLGMIKPLSASAYEDARYGTGETRKAGRREVQRHQQMVRRIQGE